MTVVIANKHFVLRDVAAFNSADFETLRHVFAEDSIIQGVPGQGEVALAFWKELHFAFAPRLTVEEIVAEGNSVAVRFLERRTFRDVFREQAPTGKVYELVAMEWFLLRDGKIQERWAVRDAVAPARQVGLTPQETSL